MEIIRTKEEDTEVMRLTGRLDTVTAPKLQATLAEVIEAAEKIELDFAAVDYLSSAGLRILLQAQKTMQKSNKSMALKNVSPEVMEVFDMTGFSEILTFV